VKYVKVELLAQMSNGRNHGDILDELGVYVSEVDVELARRAIRAIGKVGCRLPLGAEAVVFDRLVDLLDLNGTTTQRLVSPQPLLFTDSPERAVLSSHPSSHLTKFRRNRPPLQTAPRAHTHHNHRYSNGSISLCDVHHTHTFPSPTPHTQ
jgi:hypothetical protein